jgi:hypothetical protein
VASLLNWLVLVLVFGLGVAGKAGGAEKPIDQLASVAGIFCGGHAS